MHLALEFGFHVGSEERHTQLQLFTKAESSCYLRYRSESMPVKTNNRQRKSRMCIVYLSDLRANFQTSGTTIALAAMLVQAPGRIVVCEVWIGTARAWLRML